MVKPVLWVLEYYPVSTLMPWNCNPYYHHRKCTIYQKLNSQSVNNSISSVSSINYSSGAFCRSFPPVSLTIAFIKTHLSVICSNLTFLSRTFLTTVDTAKPCYLRFISSCVNTVLSKKLSNKLRFCLIWTVYNKQARIILSKRSRLLLSLHKNFLKSYNCKRSQMECRKEQKMVL